MSTLLLACTSAPRIQHLDLSPHFRALGATGAFVLYDAAADNYVMHDGERARQRFLPASTFKILNSLISLETGVVGSEREVIPWDSVDRGDWWNGDMDMRRAFERSAVWFYQVLARRVGEERMAHWVRAAQYGNMDTSGGVDSFWLNGGLRISPLEQVEFLRRLHAGTLPFSAGVQQTVRDIMRMEATADYVLRGKTGWTRDGGVHTGWLVGWVERGGNTYFFATQIESAAPDFPMRRAQQEISRGILRQLGVLPSS